MATQTLLTAATANGSGPSVLLADIGSIRLPTYYVWGVFDTATVTLEITPDGTEWFSIATETWTAKQAKGVDLSAYQVRLTVSGVGGSTNLNAAVM